VLEKNPHGQQVAHPTDFVPFVVRLLKNPRSSAATTCLLVFIRVHSWFPFLCVNLCLFVADAICDPSTLLGTASPDCRALLAMTDGGGASHHPTNLRLSAFIGGCDLVFIRVNSWFPFLPRLLRLFAAKFLDRITG